MIKRCPTYALTFMALLLSGCMGGGAPQTVRTPDVPMVIAETAEERAEREAQLARDQQAYAEAQALEKAREALVAFRDEARQLSRRVTDFEPFEPADLPRGGRARFAGYGNLIMTPDEEGVAGGVINVYGPAELEYLFKDDEFTGEVDLRYALVGERIEIEDSFNERSEDPQRTDVAGQIAVTGSKVSTGVWLALDYDADFRIDDVTYTAAGAARGLFRGLLDEPVNGNPIAGLEILTTRSIVDKSGTATASTGETFNTRLSAFGEAVRSF